MGVWYCTREDVASAPDYKETARNTAVIDRAIESASRSVEGLLRRRFYPWTGTLYFPWPVVRGPSWRLRLDHHEVISLSALVSGGVTIVPADYFLEPVNDGPPYDSIEIDLSSTAYFTAGATVQRNIAATGVFGYSADEDTAGTLAAAVSSTSATTINVSDSAAIGVGQLLRVDSERMIVTGKAWLTTAQSGTLAASNAAVTLAVSDGTAFVAGETLLLDAERVLVVDITGNNLTVQRAVQGSVLAAHTGATVYAPRTLTVQRGAVGTTAATHLNSAAVAKHAVPGPVRELAAALATNIVEQGSAGWARTVGSGDNQREASRRGIAGLVAEVQARYGRRARIRAV